MIPNIEFKFIICIIYFLISQKKYSLNEILDKILNWYFDQHIGVQAGILLLTAKIIREHSPPTYCYSKPKPLLRRNFSETTQQYTRMKQGNVCNSCNEPTKLWDYHHRDGNRSNNSASNCEALCPYCHAEKTRKKKF